MTDFENARINLSEHDITRLVFVYDNGRSYTACTINKVDFNDEDIEGNSCISYSQVNGEVSIVYRHDLAALTVHYGDTALATQKLLPCANIDGGAHIKIKQAKGTSPLSSEEKAKHRTKRIKSSIARYTKRMKKGMPDLLLAKPKSKNKRSA